MLSKYKSFIAAHGGRTFTNPLCRADCSVNSSVADFDFDLVTVIFKEYIVIFVQKKRTGKNVGYISL